MASLGFKSYMTSHHAMAEYQRGVAYLEVRGISSIYTPSSAGGWSCDMSVVKILEDIYGLFTRATAALPKLS